MTLLRTILLVEMNALEWGLAPVALVAILRVCLCQTWDGLRVYFTLDAWAGVLIVAVEVAALRL